MSNTVHLVICFRPTVSLPDSPCPMSIASREPEILLAIDRSSPSPTQQNYSTWNQHISERFFLIPQDTIMLLCLSFFFIGVWFTRLYNTWKLHKLHTVSCGGYSVWRFRQSQFSSSLSGVSSVHQFSQFSLSDVYFGVSVRSVSSVDPAWQWQPDARRCWIQHP